MLVAGDAADDCAAFWLNRELLAGGRCTDADCDQYSEFE